MGLREEEGEAYSGAQGEVAAEAHTCCADAARCRWAERGGSRRICRSLVVGLKGLPVMSISSHKHTDYEMSLLTLVIFHSLPWSVPGTSYLQGLGAGKVMVAARRGNDA